MLAKLKYHFLYYTIFGFASAELNRKFNEWRRPDVIKQIKYITALTALGYVILSFTNRFTAPENIKEVLTFYHLYIISGYGLFMTYVAHKKISYFLSELLLVAAPVFASIAHALLFSQVESHGLHQAELYLMIFWIYTISGLRLIHAITTSLFVFLVGIVYPYLSYPGQMDALLLHGTWMFITLLFGFVGGYLLQESQKSTFLKQQELERLATVDNLTGLYNRVKLDHCLSLELERAARYEKRIGIMVLDVDFFKVTNDTYGHLAGDRVLIAISKNIRQNIRSTDKVFRWGGEEFIVLCLEMDEEEIFALAEKIRLSIQQMSVAHVSPQTISIGLSLSNSQDSVNTIVKRADEALYRAKSNGRNCVVYEA